MQPPPRPSPYEGRGQSGGKGEGLVDTIVLNRNTNRRLDIPAPSLFEGEGRGGGFSGISADGLDVIVIGGGDTGTDCVGTSLRHGCKSVTQFEILPQPPLERQADNPWPEWPKVLRVDYGQEEALARFGADPRSYCITAKKFIGDAEGRLAAVETVQIEWVAGANGGGLRPQEDSRH